MNAEFLLLLHETSSQRFLNYETLFGKGHTFFILLSHIFAADLFLAILADFKLVRNLLIIVPIIFTTLSGYLIQV